MRQNLEMKMEDSSFSFDRDSFLLFVALSESRPCQFRDTNAVDNGVNLCQIVLLLSIVSSRPSLSRTVVSVSCFPSKNSFCKLLCFVSSFQPRVALKQAKKKPIRCKLLLWQQTIFVNNLRFLSQFKRHSVSWRNKYPRELSKKYSRAKFYRR